MKRGTLLVLAAALACLPIGVGAQEGESAGTDSDGDGWWAEAGERHDFCVDDHGPFYRLMSAAARRQCRVEENCGCPERAEIEFTPIAEHEPHAHGHVHVHSEASRGYYSHHVIDPDGPIVIGPILPPGTLLQSSDDRFQRLIVSSNGRIAYCLDFFHDSAGTSGADFDVIGTVTSISRRWYTARSPTATQDALWVHLGVRRPQR